ncbi:MAG: single-stranded-DNA-specific exonuclease RecJ [Oscillospiraceae bacterium]|jgi:single-stranded-DNA-specific exonuclease|nr:single-stranded-DNA-specific exonuclease RecJ [Oscillospiraceae bacterium]
MRFEEWQVKGFDRNAAVKLCRRGINPLAAVFMCSRGMTEYDDAARFITDRPSDIHDPMLLRDMPAAAERIELALSRGESIFVFGDYDVDGMTASALMKSYFRSRGTECGIYIPGRAEEGYGLNRPALEYLKSEGAELVITVDCGITAVEEADYARELGMDLIITDHHECRDDIPRAVAVVDPKRPDSRYPFSALAGVGVAFKLICALEKDKTPYELLESYGDLVAVGTIADVMPVVGENRALIRAGLRKLARNPRPGLLALMRATGAPSADINSAAIGFMLSPRLNAAGRMGQTGLSVDILLTEDHEEAERLTRELCELNTRRRELEGGIFAEVEERMSDILPDGPIVMSGENWFHGVMGIVAARTAERWMLPAVIINMDEDGIGRGSCRSFGLFRMYSALQKCCDLLINYGGHEMAAGITIARGNIDELRRRLSEIYREEIKTRPAPTLFLDFEVEKPHLLDIENVKALSMLEPFGNGNLPPSMLIRGARVALLSPVGGGKHTRLRIEKGRVSLDCIFFAAEADSLKIREGGSADVAFAPQLNEFRGRRSVQLHVIDVRPHESGPRRHADAEAVM